MSACSGLHHYYPPANRPDSPEYVPAQHAQFDANYRSLHDEQLLREAEIEEDEGRRTR